MEICEVIEEISWPHADVSKLLRMRANNCSNKLKLVFSLASVESVVKGSVGQGLAAARGQQR
jgi:hypothetical protein